MPNWRKFHEDSAELDHFALDALELKLKPRKPVHFSMLQTLSNLIIFYSVSAEYYEFFWVTDGRCVIVWSVWKLMGLFPPFLLVYENVIKYP